MVSQPQYRLLAVAGCLALLVGLFVLGGAAWPSDPDPELDLAHPAVDPADHAGEHVSTGGIVVETDPVVIEVEGDYGTERLVVEDAPAVEEGQELWITGTLSADGTLDADPERAVVRDPWELAYMYLISAVAALLVAARGIDGWRFDPRTVTVRPREVPLHERYLRSRTEAPADA